jgi:integrase
LSSVLQSLVDADVLETNPARGALRGVVAKVTPDGPGRAFMGEEVQRLPVAAKVLAPGLYDYFCVVAEAGLRAGEALALRPGDVDVAGRQLRIRATWTNGRLGPPKGKRARLVPISTALARQLAARIQRCEGDAFLFQSRRYRRRARPWTLDAGRDLARPHRSSRGRAARNVAPIPP